MRARSRCPRCLLSRKYWRSCASAGALAGRITESAWTMASSWARARVALIGSALADARGDLLHGEPVLRHGIAQLHRQVVLVEAKPHVDHPVLVHVAQVRGADLADRNFDFLDAEHAQLEGVEAPLREDVQVESVAARRDVGELEDHRQPVDAVVGERLRARLLAVALEGHLPSGP